MTDHTQQRSGAAAERGSPVVLIPLLLLPSFASGYSVTPIPGITMRVLAKEETPTTLGTRLSFHPNFVITVDADEYEAGARARLEPIGHYKSMKMPPLKIGEQEVDTGTFAGGFAITKWMLTSFVLTNPFSFVFGPIYRSLKIDGQIQKTPTTLGLRPLLGVPPYRVVGMPPVDRTTPFNNELFRDIVARLESYFRPLSFRTDRLAVAITSLWSSLCTPFPDQAYTSLAVAAEALLSTQEVETTHLLAERMACLLATPRREPIDIYRRVKRLYGTRSNIVHGSGMSKDDRRKIAKLAKKRADAVPKDYPLHMHPLTTSVPGDDMRDLTELVLDLVRAFVVNDYLLGPVQSHDDEQLNEIFLEALFCWHVAEDEPRPPAGGTEP